MFVNFTRDRNVNQLQGSFKIHRPMATLNSEHYKIQKTASLHIQMYPYKNNIYSMKKICMLMKGGM